MRISRLVSGLLPPLAALALGADFRLVVDGRPAAAILLEEKATASAQMGAWELRHHVKLMTGAELPVLFGEDTSGLPNVVRIGGGNEDLIGEQNRIVFRGRTLLLTGNDSPDHHRVDYSRSGTFPGLRECKGSLFAVYDFLNLYCDVHFYWMDETGTTYPRGRDLSVVARDREFTPPMDAFRDVYDDDHAESRFQASPRDRALWKLRWRLSSLFGQTNHNQYSIYFAHWGRAKSPALAKAFRYRCPEMFAQGYEGKNAGVDPVLRKNYPGDADLPPQLCYTCPKTIRYYADEVITYYRGGNVLGGWYNREGRHPTDRTLIKRFRGKPFFYPFEGCDSGGYCFCPRCRRMSAQDTPDDISHSKFSFVAAVAREVARTVPAAGVSTLAYIRSYGYPKGVDLPLNISVQLCPTIYSWWHPVLRRNQMEVYKEWVRKEAGRRPLTLWTYLFSTYWDAKYHYAGYKPFPGLYPWKTAEIFRMFARDGIRGWFTEVEMQYNHLEACIAARICYDPDLDTDRYIDDYFRNCYGAAAPALKEFYREVENAYWDAANYPPEWSRDAGKPLGPRGPVHPYWGTGLHSPDVNWRLGTDERMRKLDGLIARAKALVRTPEEKIRLRRIVDGIWTDAVAGKREYARMRLRRRIPPKTLMIRRIPDAHGDPGRVSWKEDGEADGWTDIFGKDIGSRCRLEAAADARHLYLHFEDPRPADALEKFWAENLELFFAGGRRFPVHHLAIAPGGHVEQYLHTFVNDARRMEKYDFHAAVDNRPGPERWRLDLAIPLDRLPITDGRLVLNFARTNPKGNALWTPIFTNSYIEGLDCYGTAVFYPLASRDADWRIWGRSWRVDDPAAPGGKAVAQDINSGWNLRCVLPDDLSEGVYKVTCLARSDAPETLEASFGLGFHDNKGKKTVLVKRVRLPAIAGARYQAIDLGECRLRPGLHFFIGGLDRKAPGKRIFVDRLVFEPRF